MNELAAEARIGMDFSVKVTAETGPDQHSERETDVASSPVCDILNLKVEAQHRQQQQQQQQTEGSHPCPACPQVLSSSRELTHHLRGHNSPRSSTDCSGEEADYACGVCHKVLSSASSLDRHVLVHSGERPFKCRYCDMAFTTNGNMNRHLRTAHQSAASPSAHSCTDSEASSDSERPPTLLLEKRRHPHHQEEFNNNEVAKRTSPESGCPAGKRRCPGYADEPDSQRRHKILLGNATSEIRGGYSDSSPPAPGLRNGCAVCGRRDFASGALLEAHMERHHPDVPAKCEVCKLGFKSHRALNLHRFMNHLAESPRHPRNSVVGFNDLTFVDFSADKFPTIARAVCEQAVHRPASGEAYQCSKCLRAFPCRSALDAHETDCGNLGDEPQHHQRRLYPEDLQTRRDDFFAGLDLQNKAALAEAKEGKDLADIQSIISVTSGPILQNLSRADACTPDNCHVKQSFGSSGSSGTTASSEYHGEEEAQDAFAAEFRRMKLKGEFPCRLCSNVFPNLRALKGHNRAHMGVAPGMPYPCNMCSYSSTDKATLLRHLRSHNGDRPYECSLCNYAFTTKANCERHVRNRHGKLVREEIKRVLIYHPSEDPTNEAGLEQASPKALLRDEARKSLFPAGGEQDERYHRSASEPRTKEEAKPGLRPSELFPGQPLELTYRGDEIEPRKQPEHLREDLDSRSSVDSGLLVNETKADSAAAAAANRDGQASPMDLKKSGGDSQTGEDAPLDLSMDVLDLSRKAQAAAAAALREKADINGNAQELGSHKEFYARNQLLLTQALLKQVGQAQPTPATFEAFYANAHMLYRNFGPFPGTTAAGMLPPYFFDPHLFGQDYAVKERIQKELVRGLQTSGGSLVEPQAPVYGAPAFPQQSAAPRHADQNNPGYANYVPSSKLLSKSLSTSARDKTLASISQSPETIKLILKNGKFTPKQKQRRYRTERPFICQHCEAKFTLRSNMERHVKQQHPQYWSQRPRGGHSARGRPPANPPTLLQNLAQSVSMQQQQQQQMSYGTMMPKLGQQLAGKPAISDQVKYAILAQQLKAGIKPEENDSDEELVIDEQSAEREPRDPTERTLSLLRGKLEANIESKASEDVMVKEEIDLDNHIEHRNDEHDVLNTKERDDDASEDDEDETSVIPEAMVKTELRDEKEPENGDLASVSEILDNASQHYQHFQSHYMSDEEGLVASTSDCNQSGSDEKSDSVNSGHSEDSQRKKKKMMKKKSAYSMAPNRVICPYCERPFPWTSSLRRHILTHTGQKPFQCNHCSLLFTTKSNCDRHLLRKHKNKIEKLLRARSMSSPEIAQEPIFHNNNVNNSQFAMRNVPERPYKCNQCPSSTFSTLGNLKKHKSTKHQHLLPSHLMPKSEPESPCSEPQNSPREDSPIHEEAPATEEVATSEDAAQDSQKQQQQEEEEQQQQQQASTDQSGYESQSSGVSDNMAENLAERLEGMSSTPIADSAKNNGAIGSFVKNSPASSPGPPNNSNNNNNSSGVGASSGSANSSANNSEAAPFKCHLCDSGFSERNDCLEHIKANHLYSYEMLVAKGALEMDFDGADEPMPPAPPPPAQNPGDGEARRFPDYSNRKVVCAFCMRRFWSAEDLRRHMRTHTGERPFSCDICCRRFTLKHSMLRHRKKHESVDSSMYVGTSGDEDTTGMSQPPTITPRSQQQSQMAQQQYHGSSLPQVASIATADAAPSGLMRGSPYDKLASLTSKMPTSAADANDNTDGDLISDLLGIGKKFLDRVLTGSANDAAELLGVEETAE